MTTTVAPSSVNATVVFDRLAAARARIAALDERIVATQIALCEIPSPTGGEAGRAASVMSRLQRIGLCDVRTDAVGNVIGVRVGEDPAAEPVVICAHLDSVF